MSNALKFTSKGKISVNIRLVSEDRKSTAIEFLITDTGLVLPKTDSSIYLKNFQNRLPREPPTLMAEQASVLPLLNNFELQGGTIAFSEEGKGSSFGFIMNFKKSNQEITNDGTRSILP
jgi:signal transduction histidine kinase